MFRHSQGGSGQPRAGRTRPAYLGPSIPRRGPAITPTREREKWTLALVGSLWFVVLFAPQWWLAARGVTVGLRAQSVLYLALLAAVAVAVPLREDLRARWDWQAPLLMFIATAVVASPFAPNRGLAVGEIERVVLFWVLVTGPAVLVKSPRRAELLVLAFGVHFAFWGLLGAQAGYVWWHTALNNHDGYGAYMVLGIGMCAYLVEASKGWYRRLMVVGLALCAIGVVASFARGAFLAAAMVFLVVWLRAERKTRMLGIGLLGIATMIAAAEVLHPGMFWAEVRSVFAEGTEAGTGLDRWELWKAAWQVFLARPLTGVGPGNWGAYAAEFFDAGDIGGIYADNPGRLYNRSLHSTYVQLLAEQGIAGITAFVWVLVDFWRRNAKLRALETQARWASMGGRLRVSAIALGLEAAMVGWLANAALYAVWGQHWFFTILALNLTLYGVVTRPPRGPRQGPQRLTSFPRQPSQAF